MDADTEAELLRLEESMWRAATRFDPDYLQRVVDPDFAEFGRSGRTYRYADLFVTSADEIDCEFPLGMFTAQLVAVDCALVTYVSAVTYDGVVQYSNRSSVWVRHNQSWRLRFHQGTPLPHRD